METITCPFCDEKGEPSLSEGPWTARKCPRCKLVFLSPRPSSEATEKLYTEDEAHWPAASHLMDYGSPTSALETARTLRTLSRYVPKGRLLELGPGSGSLLAAARARGYDVEGVELNPAQSLFIREQIGVPCANGLDEVSGTFDLIYHRDVLSHFSDPLSVFSQIHQLLAPGGYHIFETGNGDFRPRYASWFTTFQFPDHLFFFSRESLALLLERTGFTLVATQRFALTPSLLLQQAAVRVRRVGRRRSPLQTPGTSAAAPAPPLAGMPRAARAAIARAKYALRYWAGAVASKDGRPQTMVLVAKRV